MSALTSRLSAQLSPPGLLPLKEKSPMKDAETVKQEIESLFNQLQGDQQQNGGQQKSDDITNSLQTLSVAIEKRRRSESSMITLNGNNPAAHADKNGQNGDNAVSDNFDKLEKLLENIINQRHLHE